MTPNEHKDLERVIQLMKCALNAPANWKDSYIADAMKAAYEMQDDRPKVIRLWGGAA